MQLIKKLLSRNRVSLTKNQGLSTAELVGIIVIVGILGALGGTYVSGLVGQANTNAGNQNAVTLSTVANSILEAGGTLLSNNDAATEIPQLNAGVTVGTVQYQMTPPIAATSIANYTLTTTAGANPIVTFTHTDGTAP